MAKRKNPSLGRTRGLDTYSAFMPEAALNEHRRGRRAKMPASEIVGRAYNYRGMFWQYRLHENKKDPTKNEWVREEPQLWAIQLLASKNAAEVEGALESSSQDQALKPLVPLILKILGERSCPKTTEKKLDFLADSLAGVGAVSPRRSRDICARARSQERAKSPYKIIRHEYYVECECGYKGPARDNACRKCGAEILFLFDLDSGLEFP